MGHVIAFVASLFFVLFLPIAHGQTSCLPKFTALQTMETNRSFSHFLISENSQGLFTTRVLLEGMVIGESLKMKFQFDPLWEGVSLPYNLYAVMVIADGKPAAWFDFTRGCESAGISFFPGRSLELSPVKLLGSPPQRLQIMVWGKL
jgi:hypothetical protein